MSSSYFDIVVLGTDLGPLICAALLAKRGFRVLVLGQQTDRADYQVGSFRLPRRPFLFGAGRGPLARRLFAELGLQQSLRRLTGPQTPYQLALPGHRFEVPAQLGELQREIAREFPTLWPVVADFRRRVDQHAQRTEVLLEHEHALICAASFGHRASSAVALVRRALPPRLQLADKPRLPRGEALLAGIPPRHPFRWSVLLPGAFATHSDPDALTDLQLTRLFSGWACSSLVVQGGLAALCRLLTEKIRIHGGRLLLRERASQIIVEHARVRGLRLFGSDQVVGAGVVVVGVDVDLMRRLLSEHGPLDAWFGRSGEPQARLYRYTLNAVMRSQGLPAGIKRDVFLLRDPDVSARGDNALHVEVSPLDGEHSLLCSEALIPAASATECERTLDGARERLLAGLAELIPFLDRHLLLLDSPHDGRKPWGHPPLELQTEPSERRGLPTMPIVHAFGRADELCALPVRTPLKGLLLCNSQVAPALGVEGQLLAAAAAADIAHRADRGREWIRKRLWTKVDG